MTKPIRHLWLDLEDTIITPVLSGWWNTECINIEKVKAIVELWQPQFIHLFSFAIWDQAQLEQFKLGTEPMIEKAFEFKFSLKWAVDQDIIPRCCAIKGLHQDRVDFSDASAFWGKHDAFRLCMQSFFAKSPTSRPPVEVLLLDDAVSNETFELPDLNLSGNIFNIDHPMEKLCRQLRKQC